MTLRLDSQQPDFTEQFEDLLERRKVDALDVTDKVRDIIDDVRANGDEALCKYTEQFDHTTLNKDALQITEDKMKAAHDACDAGMHEALKAAAERLRTYHEKQLPQDVLYTDEDGTQLGWRWRPVSNVGLYVPGGRASYPSSVLHNAIPAKVAGSRHLSMVVPTPNGEINPAVLVAADYAGVDAVYPIGGAQAIAALSYGTETIARVDKIVGPGNAYVAEAKRQVFGMVGIDLIAGPSEILVVADDQNNPDWVAADLMSQAEHDPIAQAILITDSNDFADKVEESIETTLRALERQSIARTSWYEHGAIIVVEKMDQVYDLLKRIAPEHLELCVDDPVAFAEPIEHAGAIFMGRHTPEAIGDYIAGPSHVLPTSHTARFSSGLSVYDFIKKTSIIGCSPESIQNIGKQAVVMADNEGLGAHALSVRLRLEN